MIFLENIFKISQIFIKNKIFLFKQAIFFVKPDSLPTRRRSNLTKKIYTLGLTLL